MSVSKVLLQTVRSELKANPPKGVKADEIGILPEGKVPASSGQRYLSIYASSVEGLTPLKTVRKKTITFRISLSQRVRDIPNDRFDEIVYNMTNSMVEAMEPIIPLIESEAFTAKFKIALSAIKIPPNKVVGGYDPLDPPVGLPERYNIHDAFKFLSMNLDPIHLFPSDYLTRSGNDKEQLYDKVAGYRITAVFESPLYSESYSPLVCTLFQGP